ncbi:MAG: hypothetical protein AB8H86_26280, partial [Polyangiales bacterium]
RVRVQDGVQVRVRVPIRKLERLLSEILKVARRWRDVSDVDAAAAARLVDSVAAMTYPLVHR